MPSPAVAVIAACRFVDIADDGEALRRHLLPAAQGAGREGTVLLAREGIDLAPAGEGTALQGGLGLLEADTRCAGLDATWHAATLRGKTVVSCCSGGIRREKAAPWMAGQGLPHLLQPEGGNLRCLEQTAGAPLWRGRCVVFDEREPPDTRLAGAC